MSTPLLTVVVAFFNMAREASRTLHTLSPHYQRNVGADEYRVLAIDNGSSAPLEPASVTRHGSNFAYRYVDTNDKSPVAAINRAVAEATTPYVLCMIDGARMLSPGVIRKLLDQALVRPDPLVYCPSLHLGAQLQNDSAYNGYDQAVEDDLLASIEWQTQGYQLFNVSNVRSVPERLLAPTFESNCFVVKRETFERVGGYDTRFESSGGGMVNWEFFNRIVSDPAVEPVLVLGEASFHQFHGGASTNHPRADHPVRGWMQEYRSIVGSRYQPVDYRPTVVGDLRPQLERAVFGPNSLNTLRIAQDLIARGKISPGLALLRDRTERFPNDPAPLEDLARALNRLGRSRKAVQAIDRALAIAGTQPELHTSKAEIEIAQGRFDAANASLAHAIDLDPDHAEAYFQLGLLARHRGDTQAAKAQFGHARRLAPDSAVYREHLAYQYRAEGRDDLADEVAPPVATPALIDAELNELPVDTMARVAQLSVLARKAARKAGRLASTRLRGN